MAPFNIDGGRSYPHLPSFKQGFTRPFTKGTDFAATPGQIPGLGATSAAHPFDTQYLAWGGVNQVLVNPLNLVPDVLLTLGRSIEVVAQIVGQAGQIEFYVADVEPDPLTAAQLFLNMSPDTDRPPIAVANDATSYKVAQYTCRTRFVAIVLRNLGAGATTSWYISTAARQD